MTGFWVSHAPAIRVTGQVWLPSLYIYIFYTKEREVHSNKNRTTGYGPIGYRSSHTNGPTDGRVRKIVH
jgi:hypothetical protein